MKYVCFFALAFATALTVTVNAAFGDETANPHGVNTNAGYKLANSIESGTFYLDKHLVNRGNLTPIIMTHVSQDGSVTIGSVDSSARELHIHEYTKDLNAIKNISITIEFNRFGAFTKDDEGNYYVFSAKNVLEYDFKENNMALAKYDSAGNQKKIIYFPAQATDNFSGVRDPFEIGSCKMEISGNKLAVYFARMMFMSEDGQNHQSSYGFLLDKNNLELLGVKMPYVSHSFNQFILPIENGFTFADQGDVHPRGFTFTRIQPEMLPAQRTKSVTSFAFKQGSVFPNTFAQLGGLAKSANGYIFAGTYEKNDDVSAKHNDSRNLFILTLDNELTVCSKPIWITDYTDKNRYNVASPKIAALDRGRYLLMWEVMIRNNNCEGSYMAVIDEKGNIITPIQKIGDMRLNINDPLRYSKATGNVYWSVNYGERIIRTYSFNPYNPIRQ